MESPSWGSFEIVLWEPFRGLILPAIYPWVAWGTLGGSSGARWGALGPPLGGPRGPLGDSWGAFGVGRGTQGGTLETNYCGKAALQNHWFYPMNVYIWALGGSLGDLGWGRFLTQTGEGEGDGDRGAHDKARTKQEGAG